MSDELDRDEMQFVERVAAPLRAPERFDDGFEETLIAALRADAAVSLPRGGSRGVWQRGGLTFALAAAAAVFASIATLRIAGRRASPELVRVASVVHDTVTLVRFVFVGPAKSVALVGDFNAWGATPTQLHAQRNGAWTASVPLSKGRYEYAFIVDGKKWVPDPYAPSSADEFEANSSVISVDD